MPTPAQESTTFLPGDFEYHDDSPLVEDVDMTYEQLREAYDNEEIDRFIDIFSAVCCYVSIPLFSSELLRASACYRSPYTSGSTVQFGHRKHPQPTTNGA